MVAAIGGGYATIEPTLLNLKNLGKSGQIGKLRNQVESSERQLNYSWPVSLAGNRTSSTFFSLRNPRSERRLLLVERRTSRLRPLRSIAQKSSQ
jgi:hypothetical protein